MVSKYLLCAILYFKVCLSYASITLLPDSDEMRSYKVHQYLLIILSIYDIIGNPTTAGRKPSFRNSQQYKLCKASRISKMDRSNCERMGCRIRGSSLSGTSDLLTNLTYKLLAVPAQFHPLLGSYWS